MNPAHVAALAFALCDRTTPPACEGCTSTVRHFVAAALRLGWTPPALKGTAPGEVPDKPATPEETSEVYRQAVVALTIAAGGDLTVKAVDRSSGSLIWGITEGRIRFRWVPDSAAGVA